LNRKHEHAALPAFARYLELLSAVVSKDNDDDNDDDDDDDSLSLQ
jgi:hypothetical protein